MYLTDSKMPDLLPLLPKGGIGAEIGVLKGEFSTLLLRACAPARLHLIDPWLEQTGDYKFDISNTPQVQQDSLYHHVSMVFAGEIASQRVVLHREYSDQAADRFPANYFDWIYVDGNHTYEAVQSDLRKFAPKMKDTGFILGDDFINSSFYTKMKFGVVEAVQDFVRSEGYEFVLLTQDWRYILSKPGNPAKAEFVQRFLMKAGFVVEIANLEAKNYKTTVAPFPDGKYRLVHSFL